MKPNLLLYDISIVIKKILLLLYKLYHHSFLNRFGLGGATNLNLDKQADGCMDRCTDRLMNFWIGLCSGSSETLQIDEWTA